MKREKKKNKKKNGIQSEGRVENVIYNIFLDYDDCPLNIYIPTITNIFFSVPASSIFSYYFAQTHTYISVRLVFLSFFSVCLSSSAERYPFTSCLEGITYKLTPNFPTKRNVFDAGFFLPVRCPVRGTEKKIQ